MSTLKSFAELAKTFGISNKIPDKVITVTLNFRLAEIREDKPDKTEHYLGLILPQHIETVQVNKSGYGKGAGKASKALFTDVPLNNDDKARCYWRTINGQPCLLFGSADDEKYITLGQFWNWDQKQIKTRIQELGEQVASGQFSEKDLAELRALRRVCG